MPSNQTPLLVARIWSAWACVITPLSTAWFTAASKAVCMLDWKGAILSQEEPPQDQISPFLGDGAIGYSLVNIVGESLRARCLQLFHADTQSISQESLVVDPIFAQEVTAQYT